MRLKEKQKRKGWKTALKAALTTLLLFLLMWGGRAVVVNNKTFNPLKTALDNFHFSDIYFHWHKDYNDEVETDFVLVDIHNLREREEIATLLDSIAAYRPRVVALDVIFPKAVSLDPSVDSHLTAAVAACPQVVLGQRIIDTLLHMERSFFADSLPHHICQGVVNFSDNVVRYAELQYDTLPTFAAQVANIVSNRPVDKSALIDFGGVNIMTWTPGVEDFYLPNLKDKIVFVGDSGDLRDYHNIPVGAGGQSRMVGFEVHARATAALLSENPYHTLPRWISIVLQFILIFLFCWLLYLLPQTMDNWVHLILSILFIFILVVVSYILFIGCKLMISPSIAIIGFGLAPYSKNIVDAIFVKKKI